MIPTWEAFQGRDYWATTSCTTRTLKHNYLSLNTMNSTDTLINIVTVTK